MHIIVYSLYIWFFNIYPIISILLLFFIFIFWLTGPYSESKKVISYTKNKIGLPWFIHFYKCLPCDFKKIMAMHQLHMSDICLWGFPMILLVIFTILVHLFLFLTTNELNAYLYMHWCIFQPGYRPAVG